MGHCPCFGRKRGIKLKKQEYMDQNPDPSFRDNNSSVEMKMRVDQDLDSSDNKDSVNAKIFHYRELATATNNFRKDMLVGEGGFGAVYKGELETGQIIAVKQLDPSGYQGDKEFLVEVLMLSLLRHPNLVNLIGYCAEGEQRLLVYEYLPLGSLEDHLFEVKPEMEALDWNTRVRIAADAAKGLDYLHNQADPPVIYRDLKSSNILLDEGFHPKLSDFGLAKFAPSDKTHVSTRVMGTLGYCAPDYAGTGKLTTKSDVYSFGIVLLEMITGRKAVDMTREKGKQMLLQWARPLLKDRKNFVYLADPQLKGQFSAPILRKVVEVAIMCLQEDSQSRPSMADVVQALDYLASLQYKPHSTPANGDGRGRDGRLSEGEGQRNKRLTSLAHSMDTLLLDKNKNRENAVEEAKRWGKSWREKKPECTRGTVNNLNLDHLRR